MLSDINSTTCTYLLCVWQKRVLHDIFISLWCRKKQQATVAGPYRHAHTHKKTCNLKLWWDRLIETSQRTKWERKKQAASATNHLNYELKNDSALRSLAVWFALSLADDCYNLIMFWTIVRNIINGNWMMSWDCNTSQSIFNAGMSFRYEVFFSTFYILFLFHSGGSLCV